MQSGDCKGAQRPLPHDFTERAAAKFPTVGREPKAAGRAKLSEISEESLMRNVTYISHNSYLFKGTVRDNLIMSVPNADEKALWAVLERTNIADFLRSENGLDIVLSENAANLYSVFCARR